MVPRRTLSISSLRMTHRTRRRRGQSHAGAVTGRSDADTELGETHCDALEAAVLVQWRALVAQPHQLHQQGAQPAPRRVELEQGCQDECTSLSRLRTSFDVGPKMVHSTDTRGCTNRGGDG